MDGAQEIALAEFDPILAQQRIDHAFVKIEVRQHEIRKVGNGREFPGAVGEFYVCLLYTSTFEWPPETPGRVQNFASTAPAQVRIDARAEQPAAELVAHLAASPARVLLAAESAGRRELLLSLIHISR